MKNKKVNKKIAPKAITPFDKNLVENIKDMKFKVKEKTSVAVVNSKVGKGRIIE